MKPEEEEEKKLTLRSNMMLCFNTVSKLFRKELTGTFREGRHCVHTSGTTA
jgi:hypothetical protein